MAKVPVDVPPNVDMNRVQRVAVAITRALEDVDEVTECDVYVALAMVGVLYGRNAGLTPSELITLNFAALNFADQAADQYTETLS